MIKLISLVSDVFFKLVKQVYYKYYNKEQIGNVGMPWKSWHPEENVEQVAPVSKVMS